MALLSYYDIGTATVAAGGTAVTGQSTQWLTALREGDIFVGKDGRSVRVASIESATALTLAHAWPGDSQTSDVYEVRITPAPSEITASVRELLEKLRQGLWLTPNATGTLAERDAYDSARRGFIYMQTDVDPFVVFVKQTDTAADWSPGFSPQQGPAGPYTNIEAGTVTTLAPDAPATVSEVTVGDVTTLNFGIPAGTGFYFEGPYDNGTTYAKDSVVTTGGSAFIALQETTGNAPNAAADTAYWARIAVKGQDGTGVGDMVIATYDPQGVGADAFDRANHTGTQAIATVAGLETALDAGANRTDQVFTGTLDVLTDGQSVAFSSGDTEETPGALLHVFNRNSISCGIRSSSYWTGSTATPYQNHDSLLSEVFNTVQSNSLNRSWAGSFANWKNAIPAGVTDSGERTGVIGWAVSVGNDADYYHHGTLTRQLGVYGSAGFQGPGTPTTAVTSEAIGVRGFIYGDSAGATIGYAAAGEFIAGSIGAGGYTGNVTNNYAIYAQAVGGSSSNWVFYGAAGKFMQTGNSYFSAAAAQHAGNSSNTDQGVLIDGVGAIHAAKTGTDPKINLQSLSASGTALLMAFRWNSTVTGTIEHTSTTTTYATSSDYRLPWKEGKASIENPGGFIDALKPYYFPIAGKAGFVAHEFAETSPVSVVGEKDALYEDGTPKYQNMQASSDDVMANIVAELQALRRRVAELESASISG